MVKTLALCCVAIYFMEPEFLNPPNLGKRFGIRNYKSPVITIY